MPDPKLCSFCKARPAVICLTSDSIEEECGIDVAYVCKPCISQVYLTPVGGFTCIAAPSRK